MRTIQHSAAWLSGTVLILLAPFAPGCVARTGTGASSAPIVIPTRYDEHRFYVTPVTTKGDTLAFILDSGIDTDLLATGVTARLGIARTPVLRGTDTLWLASMPPLSHLAWIPMPDVSAAYAGRFVVVPLAGHGLLIARPTDAGVLGSPWLAGRTWTFDYPGQRLLLHPSSSSLSPGGHLVALGFATDSGGRRTSNFPRIRIKVDDDSLDMLLDTGATMNMTEGALVALADGRPPRRAGSFVIDSLFHLWRTRHPAWRVIERAEDPTGFAMIEVPVIEVGGHQIGPVWFTSRPSVQYHRAMDHLMDRPIVGSLGGSALRYLSMTIDYQRGEATFARP